MTNNITEDANEKFDKFIKDFDDKLNKDTSTIKTIVKSDSTNDTSIPNKDVHESTDTSPVKSPLLSTPTKPSRNSISLENQPLNDPIITPSSGDRIINKYSTPMSADHALKRSNTINSFRSLPKKGLNLNLNINKQQNKQPIKQSSYGTYSQAHSHTHSHSQSHLHSNKLKSPETPSLIKEDPITSLHYQEHRRRRTNSSLSTTSSGEAHKTDDINDSLRLLALKEMKIVELKDEMKALQQKIELEEAELQSLKLKIGNEFRENIKTPTQNPNNIRSPPKQSSNKSTNSIDSITTSNQQDSSSNINQQPQPQPQPKESKRASLWAKPISFLNQFDQILQNEIEKLNKEAFPQNYSGQISPQLQSSATMQKDQTQQKLQPYSLYANDDIVNTVSNSLWSFVSDVKHGLLGEDEPAIEPPKVQRGKLNQSQVKRSQSKLRIDGVVNGLNDAIIDEVENDGSEHEMTTIKENN